jgi:6-pyruvoyltetrahydropterin/6-carboxytetrahydropterin synthase
VRQASLTIHKEELDFSAGHFTIFSATEREALHGHNYYVSVSFELAVEELGLSFDYRHYKKKMLALCNQLDRHFLLPANSPHLKIQDDGDYWLAEFNHKKIPFLKEDVVLLPLTNITIEELSHWFLQHLTENTTELRQHRICAISVEVYNGPGQSSGTKWTTQNEENRTDTFNNDATLRVLPS